MTFDISILPLLRQFHWYFYVSKYYTIPQLPLWCNVRLPASPAELLRRSAAAGVTFVPGEAFYLNNAESRQIRLCFATHGENHLSEGIRRLGKIFTSGTANVSPPSTEASRPII